MFQTYLTLGFEHILDLNAYDHILFIIALCAIYRPSEWRKILILVTAFTIGHSVTLALAATGVLTFPTPIIEFLIPVTIILTGLNNSWKKDDRSGNHFSKTMKINYGLALFFGFIHGMGFSNFLKSTLLPGEEASFVLQLLAFNLGIELGQLIIVGILFVVAAIAFQLAAVKKREWVLFLSGMTTGVAVILAIETWPF